MINNLKNSRYHIAEVAIPISIALNEQFDYLIPETLEPLVSVGCRVLVPFRTSLVRGYVVKLKKHSAFEDRLKPVFKNLDSVPVLDRDLWKLAEKIHADYFCSLADALETVTPSFLKKSEKNLAVKQKSSAQGEALKQDLAPLGLTEEESLFLKEMEEKAKCVLLHDLSNLQRWTAYSALIKKTLNEKKSVIFLIPDHEKINSSLERLKIGINPYLITSGTSIPESLSTWQAIKNAEFSFVMGTRSAVFAPAHNLGLIIIEEEDHFAFRQDQVPHYRVCDIALQKSKATNARVVLGSFTPSLDSYALALSKGTVLCDQSPSYLKFDRPQDWAAIRLIDMHNEFRLKGRIVSKILEHRLAEALEKKERVLIFAQKKGFSTFLYCSKCKKTFSCPRCSSSLSYHFKEKMILCPTCQYKTESFEICPQCQSSYVKYSGYGTEKVESEILRLFPTAKIAHYEKEKGVSGDYDIMLATPQILESPQADRYHFDSVYVLTADQMLGHVDFRATEKAFSKLLRLLSMAKKEMCLQTYFVENYALTYLTRSDVTGFLKYEFKQRKELKLPPLMKLSILTVRSPNKEKALEVAQAFFKKLKQAFGSRQTLKFFEPIASIPFKVRGNYRYQISMRYKKIDILRKILRSILGERKHGVITTFDPSPL